MPKKQKRSGGGALRTLLTAPIALAGGWIAYSNLAIPHNLPLPRALDAERRTLTLPDAGLLSYYVANQASGRPLLLIHSINAAASAFEMRPLFEHYRTSRPVYALDLPGFGFSERADRVYSPELYASAILGFMKSELKEPADVVALSLGSEFAARAALNEPGRFRTLAMISPSGFGAQPRDGGERGETLYNVFSYPLWARPFYDLLTTRLSIDWFLGKSFEGPIDRDLADYDYLTAHQPGAEYAPLYFVSGKLFTPDIRASVYARLTLPVLVLYDRDAFVSFDALPEFVSAHSNWRAVRIAPTKGLPQFDKPAETAAALDRFWNESQGGF